MAFLDIKVFPADHIAHDYIVYDPAQREYYNKRTDIFLNDDDISFYKLRPYTHLVCPLPSPLPTNYFTDWN